LTAVRTTLGDFLCFPLTLVIYVPFTLLDRVTAATLVMLLGAVFFTWACTMLTVALLPRERRMIDSIALGHGGELSPAIVRT
jgi:ascorbate-specific PTS system EIIC-type component UlaA